MHILVIPFTYKKKHKPHAGVFFREQALALKKMGNKVSILYLEIQPIRNLKNNYSKIFNQLKIEDDNGLITFLWQGWNWFTGKYPLGRSTIHLIKGYALFKVYIKKYGKPDIIHAHSALNAGVLARKIKNKYNIPYIITEHRSVYALQEIETSLLRLAGKVYSDADKRIVVSPKLGELLEKKIGSEVKPWEWVPNLVNDIFFTKYLQIPNDNFTIINIGYFKKNKGQKVLLQAFKDVLKVRKNIELNLIGKGPLKNELKEYSNNIGISQHVHFLGELDRIEVLKEIQKCDVLIVSSYYETFSVVIIEALACGKPVIATKSGGPECIINNENGILVEPGNPSELKNAILDISKNYSNYDLDKIRYSCYEKFSESVVTKQLTDIYNQILISQ